MADFTAPCEPWIDADDVFSIGPCSDIAVPDQDAVLAAEVAAVASRTLFVLSGRRYSGECEATVRPCRRSARWAAPSWWGSTWNNSWGWCACQSPEIRHCGCGHLDEILLGGDPIREITQVLVDGDALPTTAYRVDDDRWLVRIDGEGWPCCQDLTLEDDQVGTWSVEFTYGRDVPADGVFAAKVLACELYQAKAGGDCRLPARVQSVVRQGIQIAFLDPQEFLDQGRTGIYEVDLFLSVERYGQAHRSTVVASPDFLPQVRHTG